MKRRLILMLVMGWCVALAALWTTFYALWVMPPHHWSEVPTLLTGGLFGFGGFCAAWVAMVILIKGRSDRR